MHKSHKKAFCYAMLSSYGDMKPLVSGIWSKTKRLSAERLSESVSSHQFYSGSGSPRFGSTIYSSPFYRVIRRLTFAAGAVMRGSVPFAPTV